jgi:hypothetical protein
MSQVRECKIWPTQWDDGFLNDLININVKIVLINFKNCFASNNCLLGRCVM